MLPTSFQLRHQDWDIFYSNIIQDLAHGRLLHLSLKQQIMTVGQGGNLEVGYVTHSSRETEKQQYCGVTSYVEVSKSM